MCPGLPWSEKSKWSRDQSKVLGKRGRMLPKCSFSIFTSVNIQPCAYILYMFSFQVVLLIKVKQFDTSEQTSLEGMFTSQVDTKTKFIRFRWLPISKFAFRNIFWWSSPIIEHDLNSDLRRSRQKYSDYELETDLQWAVCQELPTIAWLVENVFLIQKKTTVLRLWIQRFAGWLSFNQQKNCRI